MCLLTLAWCSHPDYPLILAGNRDERHARASAAAGFWSDAPEVLGGRDLEAGGTWLGLTTAGRYAVVTNYRDGLDPAKAPRSRGALTAEFLKTHVSPEEYLHEMRSRAGEYGGFSLIVGDQGSLWYFANRGGEAPKAVAHGVHALSNHLLDSPWPKVQTAKARLKLLLDTDTLSMDAMLKMLADRTPAETGLPDTGVGAELERRLSAAFVADPLYGTRCSTVVMLHKSGSLRFSERRFDATGAAVETRHFRVESAA
ncbi:MAG TPA: NRDE family protein [Gammaproteobacteria bacterium]|nr:NRDE family protein [Gammaproteobacteria bacterium]